MDRKAFNSISYGLYIVSSVDADGRYVGCVANTFQQVTSEPPMVSVALNKENHTTKCIDVSKKFCVSVLSESADMELVGKFGFHSSKDVDKFEAVSFNVAESGLPELAQCSAAVFHVDVVDTVDVGTHILFIGEVKDARVVSDETPMTYSYYHTVLRGKTPPKASSYNGGGTQDSNQNFNGEAAADKDTPASSNGNQGKGRIGWRCSLCGYVVEMDELPDDFECPICGMGKEFFERIELD